MVQGMAVGAIGAVMAVLTVTLGLCINDNLDVRNDFSELKAAVLAANKQNMARKLEVEDASRRTQEESDIRYNTMRANLRGRLNIMHNDRNKWLERRYPTTGKNAEGLPPVCFNRLEFNRSQQDSERSASNIANRGEEFRLDLILARDWANKQRWTEE